MKNPNKYGWQIDWPVFVKAPFNANNRDWDRGDHFNWRGFSVDAEHYEGLLQQVYTLYNNGFLHHNPELEKEAKVGDRLEEMDKAQLEQLVTLLNVEVKKRTNSTTEFNNKKCKQSAIEDKQRGLIRSFLRNNRWVEEDFYRIRATILGE